MTSASEFEYPWRFQGRRSAVMSPNAMVATSQPLAAQAGLRTLEAGGTAADAAVAGAAVLNLVEPNMTGIGGDMFALTYFDGEYAALNGSGPAPADATLEAYRERTDATEDGEPAMPTDGGLPVTVPGALDGWARLLERYGALSLAEVLEPAIELARTGFPVSEYVARQWAMGEERLARFDASAETFLSDGRAPAPGTRFRNPDLAETFETVAAEGPDALYGGSIGADLVEVVRANDGALRREDLEAYESEWTEPIATEYGGVEVVEHPPNGQGAIALEALNLASYFDLPEDPTHPDRLHYLIEATKLAFADGYAYITDPAAVDVPTGAMIDPGYAAERSTEIGSRAGRYGPDAAGWIGEDTVYLTAVDEAGNAVSFINSVYANFGSALTVPGRGFALQNRGHSFSLDPEDANALAPGKRPFHTIIPAMLRDPDGSLRASWGVMGGSMQPQGHLQVASNMIDAGLNPQAALDVPRFRWLDGKRVALETSRLPDRLVTALENRGHRIVPEGEYFERGGHWGGGQIVYLDDDGSLVGGSDPRKDGHAVGY